MAPATVLRLANDFSNIIAIKEASGNLAQCMDLVQGKPAHFAILSGDDDLILPQASVGMEGVISVAANSFPKDFTTMVRYALDGILSFSIKPLQLAIGLGLFTVCLSVIGIVYALALRIFTSVWVEGWTALMIAVLFLGGVQLLSLGIIGEYVGRIYGEVQRRPLYVVRQRIGFARDSGADTE